MGRRDAEGISPPLFGVGLTPRLLLEGMVDTLGRGRCIRMRGQGCNLLAAEEDAFMG